MSALAPGLRSGIPTQTRASPRSASYFSMWNLSGVLSSPAMKRRSLPYSLAASNLKLPACRRTRTGAAPMGSVTSAPAALVSTRRSLRPDQSSFHQALAAAGGKARPATRTAPHSLLAFMRDPSLELATQPEVHARVVPPRPPFGDEGHADIHRSAQMVEE